MSRALVIPNADFSANAMEQIVVSEPIPCTGITLDRSTGEITAIGDSLTLIATPVPSDTTDKITWSSDDETVVIVNNGVVTTVGVGTATITATCGNSSASCVITSRAFITGTKITGAHVSGATLASGGNGLGTLSAGASRGCIVSDTGTYSLYKAYEGVMYYPIPLPQNTTRIRVTVDGSQSLRLLNTRFFDYMTPVSGFPTVAQLITSVAGDSTDVIFDNGTYEFAVPSVEGYNVNSLCISFRSYRSPDNWVDSDWNHITVEYLPAE